MNRQPHPPETSQTSLSFGNRLLTSLSRFFSGFNPNPAPAAPTIPAAPTTPTAPAPPSTPAIPTGADSPPGDRTDTATPPLTPPAPAPEAAAEAQTPGVFPQYRWRPQDQYATARDALAIVTPLPDGTQVVGYPTLADPDAELKLFQVQSSGDPFQQQDLARLLPPGEMAVVACAYYPAIHEDEIPHKRNVGHACLAVGVEREVNGQIERGVMTINNPQTYLGGAFSGGGYGTFFIQDLIFPADITPAEVAAYKQNIVTMTALANTYIPFARDYNGGDPLGAFNEAKVREVGEQVILATYGDVAARQWLKEARNTAYCAELVSAGINAGATVILSKAYLDGLQQKLAAHHGEDRYPNLYEVVRQRVDSKAFLADNGNQNLKYARLAMVDEAIDLQPINQRCPDADQSGTGLAFKYYDFTDIAYFSIRDTYPRQDTAGLEGSALQAAQAYNAKVAQIQAQAFQKAAQRFKGLANLEAATEAAFDLYVDEVVGVLEQTDGSETEKENRMAVLVEQGRRFTPTGPNGEGMFIPPDLYLMPREGWADLKNIGVCFFPENLQAL